jgi:hypothetical protein
MPIRYWIDKDRRLVRFTLSGVFSTREMFDAVGGALRDPKIEKGFDVLSDHSRIERFITTPEVTDLVQFIAGFNSLMKDAKWAVITRHPASYGMMRMLSVYLENIPMKLRLFESEDDALDWLRPPGD